MVHSSCGPFIVWSIHRMAQPILMPFPIEFIVQRVLVTRFLGGIDDWVQLGQISKCPPIQDNGVYRAASWDRRVSYMR